MQTATIPAGLTVSVRPDEPGYRSWRAHTMRRSVTGPIIDGRSGAVVVRVDGWLILTTKERIRESIQRANSRVG